MAAKVVNRIDTAAVHRISSGQLVLDLAAAVKELVENSIDAGATNIEIKFKENGLEGLEVADNGSGIDPVNYENLALKHYTSKLRDFTDLEKVKTLGFRGEALSSLCATCDLLVTTATQEQAPKGVQLVYNTEGHLVSTTPSARAMGTTVQLLNFFHSLPVRQREYKRNIKREYGKAIAVIQAYGIICEGIRIKAINQPSKGQSTRIISTNGNKAIKDNIANIFGSKLLNQIIPLELDLSEVVRPESESGRVYLRGYMSKPEQGLGRSSSDRQYFYINGRPCNIPKLAKGFNELYHNFIVNQYPFLVVNLEIPTDSYDVNVTPDKRTIFIHNEERLVNFIIEKLREQLEPSRYTYTQRTFEEYLSNNTPETSLENSPSSSSLVDQHQEHTLSVSTVSSSPSSSTTTETTRGTAIQRLKSLVNTNGQQFRPHASFTTSTRASKRANPPSGSLESFISKRARIPISESSSRVEAQRGDDDSEMIDSSEDVQEQSHHEDENDVDMLDTSDEEGVEQNRQASEDENGLDTVVEAYRESVSTVEEDVSSSWSKSTQTQHLTQQVHIDWAHICSLFSAFSTTKDDEMASTSKQDETMQHNLEDASITNTRDNDKAAAMLNRIIQKTDFQHMRILGQFNLGFIVVSLDDHDLFLIDQHASDEKYNFETLQLHTRLEGQRLYTPQHPELTVAEEIIAVENVDILRANGFEIDIDLDQEPTRRIKVVSQPVSKSTSFDSKDFSEIIHLLAERPGQMVRCSRVRAMFASRACRRSVMIGDSLTERQMTEIVRHMGEIDQPWNCPHGRPTMRHLCNLSHLRTAGAKGRKLTFQGSLFRSSSSSSSSSSSHHSTIHI